jgi:hypothetical protein
MTSACTDAGASLDMAISKTTSQNSDIFWTVWTHGASQIGFKEGFLKTIHVLNGQNPFHSRII